MTCKDVLALIEPIAGGDLEPDTGVREHIETCPRCAAELALARRIQAMLASRPAAVPPGRFTGTVLQRIRREQWRAEQHVDRVFNVAIAAALVLIAGGTLAFLNLGGVLSVAGSAWDLASGVGRTVARDAAPSLNTYVAAAALLGSALGMWWWADRTFSL